MTAGIQFSDGTNHLLVSYTVGTSPTVSVTAQPDNGAMAIQVSLAPAAARMLADILHSSADAADGVTE